MRPPGGRARQGAGGPRRAGPLPAETHAVIGAHRVEGVGAAHEQRGLVTKQQHLHKVSTLALGMQGKPVWAWSRLGWGRSQDFE